ncbi:MAG: TolC family protein [bacterium]|nr:TolC family protein [bacterium]
MRTLRPVRRGLLTVCLWALAAAAQTAPATAPVAMPADDLLLSVDDAVRLALERSRDLRSAAEDLAEARAQASETWGQVWPQVSASASYVRNISPAVSFVPARVFDATAAEDEFISLQFGADNSWQSAIRVEQALFDPALLVSTNAAARFERLQVEVLRGRTQEVATRVRLLCYELLLREEEVRLTERSLERVRQALAETEARSRAGMATSYDALRLQVELSNLQPAQLRARNAVAAAQRQLSVELDLAAPRRLRLTQTGALTDTLRFPALTAVADSTEIFVDRALAQRSDMRQLEQLVSLRQTQVRLEQVDYLPTVSLFGSWDVQAQQNGSPDFFGTELSRATSKLAGVSLRLPLFTGLQRHARVHQRQAVHRQARTQLQLGRDQAAAQVRDLLESLLEAGAREHAQRRAVAQAGRGYEIAMARYQKGVGSRLEMTDAEIALRQSEFNHAQAAHDVLTTRARLDFAVGRVSPVDNPPTLEGPQ